MKDNNNLDEVSLLKAKHSFQALIQEFHSFLEESRESILAVKSRQNDAVKTLSESFGSLLDMTDFQSKGILKLTEAEKLSLGNTHIENIVLNNQALQKALNNGLRSLQFDDINTQNLNFIEESLNFLQHQLVSLKESDLASADPDVIHNLQEVKEYREKHSNPVSSKSVDEGGFDLF